MGCDGYRRGRSDVFRPALKELLCGGCVEWSGEQEALTAVAILASQQRELVLYSMPSAKGLDRERLAELHESVDQRLALLVVLQPEDERPVRASARQTGNLSR